MNFRRNILLLAASAVVALSLSCVSGAAAAPVAKKTRVIVTLAVASTDSAAITQTTDTLLAALPAGDYKVDNRFLTMPMITLTVGRVSLTALKLNPLVASVEKDTTVSASGDKVKCKTYKIGDGKKGVKICKKVKPTKSSQKVH